MECSQVVPDGRGPYPGRTGEGVRLVRLPTATDSKGHTSEQDWKDTWRVTQFLIITVKMPMTKKHFPGLKFISLCTLKPQYQMSPKI